MSKIYFDSLDDETLEVWVDDEMIGSVNHDQHGWAGMEAVETLVKELAFALNLDLIDNR